MYIMTRMILLRSHQRTIVNKKKNNNRLSVIHRRGIILNREKDNSQDGLVRIYWQRYNICKICIYIL